MEALIQINKKKTRKPTTYEECIFQRGKQNGHAITKKAQGPGQQTRTHTPPGSECQPVPCSGGRCLGGWGAGGCLGVWGAAGHTLWSWCSEREIYMLEPFTVNDINIYKTMLSISQRHLSREIPDALRQHGRFWKRDSDETDNRTKWEK